MHRLTALAWQPGDMCRLGMVAAELVARGNLVRGQLVICKSRIEICGYIIRKSD